MLQSDYIIIGKGNIYRRGQIMNEQEWNKLTEEQQKTIAEICMLINDNSLQDLLADQLSKERELLPFIKTELKKAYKDPEVNNLTVFDILDAQTEKIAHDNNWITTKSKAVIILERAIKQAAKVERAKEARKKQRAGQDQAAVSAVPNIHYCSTNEVNLTTGNFTQSFYTLAPEFKTTPEGKQYLEVPFCKDRKSVV